MAKVLLYNIKDDYDIDKFEKIAYDREIEIIRVGKSDIDQLVGFLLAMENFEKKDDCLAFDENLDFPFILFADFDKNGLFDLLDTMRENNLAIQHKASETANNVHWTLRELLIENDKEGKMMGLINNINKLLEKAKSLKEIHGEDPKLKSLVNDINAYFNNQSLFDFEVAKKYYLKLLDEILRIEEETK